MAVVGLEMMKAPIQLLASKSKRPLAVAVGLIALVAAAQTPAPADEEVPSVQNLARVLERDYHLTPRKIAEYVTFLGLNVYTRRARLVRWHEGTLAFAVLTKGVAPSLLNAFKSNMDKTTAKARLGATYCIDELPVSDSQLREIPSCLTKAYDVMVFIDGSPEPSPDILRSLAIRTATEPGKDFWNKYAGHPSQPTAFCDGHVSIGSTDITASDAYFRVVQEGATNLGWVNVCSNVLPFIILGQMPIRKSASEQTFVSELLELNYSPELRPGMELEDILKILDQQSL